MAIDLKVVRDRVRGRIRDTDDRKPSFDPIEIDQAIVSRYITEQARLPGQSLYTASALTISAGGDTFSLPATVTQWTGNDGGAEFDGDVRIQLVSTGLFLQREPREVLEAFKNGAPSVQLGIPEIFALYEGTDQTVNGLCYPAAKVAEACNLYRILMADDPRDFVGAGTDDMDDVELQMSRLATTALECMTAADLVDTMTDADLAARRLRPTVTNVWRQQAEVSFQQERARRMKIKGAGHYERVWR